MLTDQHRMELLNRAYIQAIMAEAGLNLRLAEKSEFDYGVDGTFRSVVKINEKMTDGAFLIDFQSKATTQWRIEREHIIYHMEADEYNKLVQVNNTPRAMPRILILFCLPNEIDKWTVQTEEYFSLYKCCYWERITGIPTSNNRTTKISIPRSQMLIPNHLNQMIRNVEEGIW